MSDHQDLFRRPLHALMWGLCVSLGCLACNNAHAASMILSTGFESPYALGTLQGQQGWITAGSGGSTATVQSSVVKTGSQAVQVTKAGAPGTDRRWAVQQSGLPTQRYIIVDWDMRVSQPSNLTASGPFFGVESYDGITSPQFPKLLGSLGVNATTGDVLYQTQGNGYLTPTGTIVPFNQWNHFRIVLDFNADSYGGYVNGALVSTAGFVDGGNSFTDADISTFATGEDAIWQSLSASAVFDNFTVRDGLLGDYNLDGTVNVADYTQWRTTFGSTISPAGNFADGNRNGVVDAADYVIWRDNLGASVAPGAGAGLGSIVVPEPASWLLLLGALPGILRLRRSRSSWRV